MTKEKRPFVKKTNGYGLVGMTLNLSLAQCQVLSAMHEAFSEISEGGMITPGVLIQDTLAFLRIFKGIESPIADGIWDDGYLIDEEGE